MSPASSRSIYKRNIKGPIEEVHSIPNQYRDSYVATKIRISKKRSNKNSVRFISNFEEAAIQVPNGSNHLAKVAPTNE